MQAARAACWAQLASGRGPVVLVRRQIPAAAFSCRGARWQSRQGSSDAQQVGLFPGRPCVAGAAPAARQCCLRVHADAAASSASSSANAAGSRKDSRYAGHWPTGAPPVRERVLGSCLLRVCRQHASSCISYRLLQGRQHSVAGRRARSSSSGSSDGGPVDGHQCRRCAAAGVCQTIPGQQRAGQVWILCSIQVRSLCLVAVMSY